jgi:acyl-CoA reductase-like NAD-dependent aldehyde dehydrogenase
MIFTVAAKRTKTTQGVPGLSAPSAPTYGPFIAGERQLPAGARYFGSVNPATGETIAQIVLGGAAEIDAAVAAATAAQRVWAGLGGSRRAELIWAWTEAFLAKTEEIALADVRDMGKVISDARYDTPKAAKFARYWAGMADKLTGEQVPATAGYLSYTIRQPLGVLGIILPWNGPTIMFVARVAIALACGNAVVVKPSELAPTSALLLAEAATEAGLPAGLVNVVPGDGSTGQALVEHPGVAGINFTGSVASGRRVATAAAPMFKQVVLELGGKAPNIVFDDADLDDAIRGAAWGVFQNAGQTCSAATRLLVQHSIAEQVVERLTSLADRIRVGDPMDPSSHIGPVVSEGQHRRVLGYIDSARSDGARVITATNPVGSDPPAIGLYVTPTVVTDLDPSARVAREEIFGPVLSVLEFEDAAEAIALANDSVYGLTANVWTTDLRKMLHLADALECGVVWGNSAMLMDPALAFGGIKDSGLGVASGREAIDAMTRLKRVSIRYAADAPIPAWSDI